MDAAKIDWLHRLGIDVWCARRIPITVQGKSGERGSPNPTKVRSGKPSTRVDQNSSVESEHSRSSSSKPDSNAAAHSNASNVNQRVAKPPSGTKRESSAEDVNLHVYAIDRGIVLCVFDHTLECEPTLLEGILRSINGYEPYEGRRVEFIWPPQVTRDEKSAKQTHSLVNAQRSFQAIFEQSIQRIRLLLTVGVRSHSLTENLLEKIELRIRLDHFPEDAESKRELWIEIQSKLALQST